MSGLVALQGGIIESCQDAQNESAAYWAARLDLASRCLLELALTANDKVGTAQFSWTYAAHSPF
jgi:hypothetical protein